jgi:ABC-2 type transport system permease protein
MLRDLQIEWMKVKSYRTFWILLGITLISIPGFNYMLYDIMDNKFPKQRHGQSILGSPFAFPEVWQTTGWNAGILFLIPAILIITLTTNEFTYKTHRQNIIDGWSRMQFIRVKLVEILLLSFLTTLIVIMTSLAFGYIGNKVPADISVWQDSRYVFFYFVQMLSYSLIAFLLSILIKRAGLAMGIFFIYMIVEHIIVGLVGRFLKINAVDYLPEQVANKLIPFPYIKAIVSPDEHSRWESHLPSYLVVAFLYLVIYCLVTSRYFLKKDL